MRIIAATVRGVGGVPDGRVALPAGPVAALAGANGTGKSKLLACLLSHWLQTIPSPQGDGAAEVTVELQLNLNERRAIASLSTTAGWGAVEIPEMVSVRTVLQPLIGVQRLAEPRLTVLHNMWTMQEFLQSQSSLNVLYLPAERRLLPPSQSGIDLSQLSEMIAWQTNVASRNAVQNYGRLDDQEFEQFAKALCVSSTLPSEEGNPEVSFESRLQWPEFVETVDNLIAPKRLLPLSKQNPDQLRIATPSGGTHSVQDLSSGERQALIIISRALRAGAGHTVVLIDEPDAYLHPHLSKRLFLALERGVGADGQLVVATHSPSILDGMAPNIILRMSHDELPRVVADEDERVDLYRGAGFRASALTQSDLLLITEGESDVILLSLLFPELARAAIRSAGNRARVLREVEQLAPYQIPILGTVDGDVMAPQVPETIGPRVIVWPSGDIEGLFLADDAALQLMLELGLIKPQFGSVPQLRNLLTGLRDGLVDNVVAEVAQSVLRRRVERQWPSPRGAAPIDRLREATAAMTSLTGEEVDSAISGAVELWNAPDSDRWMLVRGKYVLGAFADQASEMRSGRALLEAVARARPDLSGFNDFRSRLTPLLA